MNNILKKLFYDDDNVCTKVTIYYNIYKISHFTIDGHGKFIVTYDKGIRKITFVKHIKDIIITFILIYSIKMKLINIQYKQEYDLNKKIHICSYFSLEYNDFGVIIKSKYRKYEEDDIVYIEEDRINGTVSNNDGIIEYTPVIVPKIMTESVRNDFNKDFSFTILPYTKCIFYKLNRDIIITFRELLNINTVYHLI